MQHFFSPKRSKSRTASKAADLTKSADVAMIFCSFSEEKTMKEIGRLNRQIDSALNRQGHMDWLMVVDAGFPCPVEVGVIPHAELKKLSREVKTIVRTGDFTA